ncbi:hypothetical protein GCM10027287_13120 [Bordetella muralis]
MALKRQTIAHTEILLEGFGNLAASHKYALRQRVDSFERLFSDRHAALARACETGHIEEAKAIIKSGAEPSLVLMRTLDRRDNAVSPNRAALARNLTLAGADATTALEHAIATNTTKLTKQTLLLLRAAGNEVLGDLLRWGSTHVGGIVNLLMSKKDWSDSLVSEAINSNPDIAYMWAGMEAMRMETTTKQDHVLMPLAKGRHTHVLGILIRAGMDAHTSLLRLLDDGNTDAVRSLIAAGADVSKVLTKMASHQPESLTPWITKLQVLIQAGGNVSKMLLDSTKDPSALPVAKLLIAAGARIDDALTLVREDERSHVREILDSAAQDVADANTMMHDSGLADITFVENILAARELRTQADNRELYESVKQQITDGLEDKDRPAGSALLDAFVKLDWNALKTLVPANQKVAADLLLYTVEGLDVPSSRLLIQAGTDISPAIDVAIADQNTSLVLDLINAGASIHSVLSYIVDSGNPTFAKEVIQEGGESSGFELNFFNTLKFLANNGDEPLLKKLVPLSSTNGSFELIDACAQGEMGLARALVAAGADAGKALYIAISSELIDAAIALMDVGADRSVALAAALSDGEPLVAETLLVLGADLNVALTHVNPQQMETVRELLPANASS